jgi:ankyrin repeat protein
LGLAASSGKAKLVDLLLNYGAAIDKRCPYSIEIPLMVATRLRSRTIVDLLLQRGANIQSTDRSRKTSLHIACKCGNKGLVDLLL